MARNKFMLTCDDECQDCDGSGGLVVTFEDSEGTEHRFGALCPTCVEGLHEVLVSPGPKQQAN